MKKIKQFVILNLIVCVFLLAGEVNKYKKGNLVIENIPEIPIKLVKNLNSYQDVRSAYFLDWLPDDKGILISTRFSDVAQIHQVEFPGGMRRQFTFFDEPVGGGWGCPDYSIPYFLFSKDSAGNECDQIYKFNYLTGAYDILTDGKSKYGYYLWSRKGDRFAFTSTKRNNKDFDIYLGDLTGETSHKLILKVEGNWSPVDWSFDDTKLLLHKYISANESQLFIFDIKTSNLTEINPVDKKVSYDIARWTKGDKGLFYISDEFGEFNQLIYYDIKTGNKEILTKNIPWDITTFDLSPNGDTIAFVSNENGIGKLYILELPPRKINLINLPIGWVGGIKFKPDGKNLALTLNTYRAPGDVYSLEFKNRKLIRWTYSEIAGLDTTRFVAPELFYYETFDSADGKPRMIPAYVYKPKKSGPYPVIIDLHGGPSGQYIPTFSPMIQYYVNELGCAVICPNFRGSSGYGKTFLTLDDGYKREDAVKDIGKLLDWIEKNSEFDSKRIAVVGGSYGGYMVLACMVHYSERLKCGIDFCGISNFVTFLENTADYRKDLRRTEYGDERNSEMRDFLIKISPPTNSHKIKKPLFVVQGLNDPRVPVNEARQIVEAVRKNNVDVWFLLAEDEGHGFSKKSNRDFYQQALVLFLEKYLLK
uniref:S9 family peptidase n=1 Tax=candidate division WOR-3 bacterium TaxID=2052148 RepID=A0A7V1EH77_UNCW3